MVTGATAYFSIGSIRLWLAAQGPYRVTEALEISPMDVEDDGALGFSLSYYSFIPLRPKIDQPKALVAITTTICDNRIAGLVGEL
jgi:hypothetical protein